MVSHGSRRQAGPGHCVPACSVLATIEHAGTMVTLSTLERLNELEQRLDDLGLQPYRDALDDALRELGGPAHRFLRTGEAARRLGVSVPTVKRWGRRGILPIARVRGRWIVPADSVERLVASAPSLPGEGPLEDLGAPLPRDKQHRMLELGRKADRGRLTAAEEAEYRRLIDEAEQRSARAALAALASRGLPAQANGSVAGSAVPDATP
jgi:excisionase family DNA binding protein